MTTFSIFIMDKDRGYAWVILGASTILMCVGPSTFSAYGFLLRDLPITLRTKSWILNLFYVCWLLSAFLVACFVKHSPRQLATTGAAIAAIGFLTSASMTQDVGWLYLTFSIFVGFGLGLSFHTAYLVVMSNFDHYKGLANGICQLCIAIGQITTPFLFTIVSLPRDRFQIKALTTAIAFLTTLFFVVPTAVSRQRRPTLVGDRNRRPSTVSRRGSLGGEGAPLHSGFIPAPSNSIPIGGGGGGGGGANNQGRTRRRSQYLLAVSTSLLPNIPEEPESTHSTNDTLTSVSSDSDISNFQPSSLGSPSINVISPDSESSWNELEPLNSPRSSIQIVEEKNQINAEKNKGDSSTSASSDKNEPSNLNPHSPLRRLSMPTYVGTNDLLKTPDPIKAKNENSTIKKNSSSSGGSGKRPVAPRIRRYSESQLQSNNKNQKPQLNNDFTPVIKNQGNLQTSKKPQQSQESSSKNGGGAGNGVGGGGANKKGGGESFMDLSLLKDYQFLNMASFSSLCTMTVVNYPIVLYVHIISKCGGGGGDAASSCTKEADVALIIIYMVDLISRLLFSYLADIAAFSKRRSFHVACCCAGVLIAATSVVDDIALLYCFCVVYGVCLGLMVTSEYLMFIECFGFQRFPYAYGFLNVCKLVVVAVLGLIAINPLSVYLYPIHPLDQVDTPRNSSSYEPTALGDPSSPESGARILLGLAVPPVLCTLAWLTEDIYKMAFRRCTVPHTEKAEVRTMAIP